MKKLVYQQSYIKDIKNKDTPNGLPDSARQTPADHHGTQSKRKNGKNDQL